MMLQIQIGFVCFALYFVLIANISLSDAQSQYGVRDDHYGAYQSYNNAHMMRYQQQQQPTQEDAQPDSEEWNDEDNNDDHDARQYQQQYQSRSQQQPSLQQSSQNQPYYPQQQQQQRTYQEQPLVGSTSDPSVVIVPRLGQIRGNPSYRLVNQQPVRAYLGIKYGTVGNGIARFQPAKTPYHNHQPIDATREAPRCPQFPDFDDIQKRESDGEAVDDCLTLNIYTRDVSAIKPVIVFAHGEMLFDGGAEEGQPDYLLKHDVVLVSVNYRLAPFGFLSTLTDELPGNVALADLQLALQWVQDNIQPFGGNRDSITLIGQSGGATLVHALSLSEKAQGLFHKLILQSGTALNPYFIDEDPLSTARNFARTAGCSVNNNPRGNQELNDCLARLSTTDLLNAFKRHWKTNEVRGLLFSGGFKLSIGDRLGFLTEHPAALVAKTNTSYPLIAGVAKDAGAFILSRFYDELKQISSRNITDYISAVLRHIAQPRHHGIWIQLARREIFTIDDERNPSLENLAGGLLELVNLVLYRGPVIDSIRYTHKKQPTFLYCFAYRGQHHRFGNIRNPLPFAIDATLSDDNLYIFPYPEEVRELDKADRALSNQLTEDWVNFVNFNRPTQNEVWPRLQSELGPVVRINKDQSNNEFIMETDPHFGEGIAPPNLYPQYFTTTTTTTSTTSRPNYQPSQNRNNNYSQPSSYYSPRYQPDYSRANEQSPQYPYPYRPRNRDTSYQQQQDRRRLQLQSEIDKQ